MLFNNPLIHRRLSEKNVFVSVHFSLFLGFVEFCRKNNLAPTGKRQLAMDLSKYIPIRDYAFKKEGKTVRGWLGTQILKVDVVNVVDACFHSEKNNDSQTFYELKEPSTTSTTSTEPSIDKDWLQKQKLLEEKAKRTAESAEEA